MPERDWHGWNPGKKKKYTKKNHKWQCEGGLWGSLSNLMHCLALLVALKPNKSCLTCSLCFYINRTLFFIPTRALDLRTSCLQSLGHSVPHGDLWPRMTSYGTLRCLSGRSAPIHFPCGGPMGEGAEGLLLMLISSESQSQRHRWRRARPHGWGGGGVYCLRAWLPFRCRKDIYGANYFCSARHTPKFLQRITTDQISSLFPSRLHWSQESQWPHQSLDPDTDHYKANG